MEAKRNARWIMSPVFLAGVTSFAIVSGVSALKVVSDGQMSRANTTVTTEAVLTAADQTVQASAATADPAIASDETYDPDTQIGAPSTAPVTSESHATVTVNGTTYTAGEGEQVHTTTSGNNGQTSVNISVQSSGSGQQYSSASSQVNVFSNSFTVLQSNGTNSP